MKNTPLRFVATALISLGAPCLLLAQTSWDGGGANTNWSTFENWSTNLSPAATAVTFGADGVTGGATEVGNIVDNSYSLASLAYGNTGASAWQVTQIASGQTLTVTGAFRVGTTQTSTGLVTVAALTGPGSFVVNDAASVFSVASNVSSGSNRASRATLDMSALGSFTATVSAFSVGNGTHGFGTLYLADNSTITSDTLTTGGTSDYNGNATVSNQLYFGNSTVLNVDAISLASGRSPGLVQFRPASSAANADAATDATLVIRGKAGGTSRATLSIGDMGGGSSSQAGSSLVDLTGGSVDARVGSMSIGRSDGTLNGNYSAGLSMAAGTFDATEVRLGEVINTSAGTGSVTGTLSVSGGTFTAGAMTLGYNTTTGTRGANGVVNVSGTGAVDVTGDLVMGRRNGATVQSTVNVSGGSLTVGGNMTEGVGAGSSITSTVNLSGGVLDMTRGNVAVDTFNFTGGALRNVASFSGNLNVQNASSLGFDNIDGAFSAMSLTGTLTLGANADLSLSLASGFTPGASLLLINNDGTGDTISGTFFSVNGVSLGGGNTFTIGNNTGTYLATLFYNAGDGNDLGLSFSAIPEPSTYAALAGVLALGLVAARRNRRSEGVV